MSRRNNFRGFHPEFALEILEIVSELRKRLGARIRALRLQSRLSQEGLGERAGVSYKFLGEVERGQGNPTIETLARIAGALNVEVTDLLTREPLAGGYAGLSPAVVSIVRDARNSLDEVIKSTRRRRPRR